MPVYANSYKFCDIATLCVCRVNCIAGEFLWLMQKREVLKDIHVCKLT